MGAYLCIARNGVQPAVSKRIIFNVDCKCILSKYLALILSYASRSSSIQAANFLFAHEKCNNTKTPSFSQDE